MYRLYSWEHSYFSGKARAYLRFKESQGALGAGFEDILATPELIQGWLAPRTGTIAVPQLETPDGTWVQDTSEIIDHCEAAHPEARIVPDPEQAPRQCLSAYLIELLADEWMVVPAFWQRWYFSEPGHAFSHLGFNEQQWGAALAPDMPGDVRRAAGAQFFEQVFGISDTRNNPKGVYAGLVHLGVDEKTETAWQQSQHRILALLEAHFSRHDYILGGWPSLADYGLLGPLYAHLYRDAVPGFALRTHFPIVCEWVERTNGEGALNARKAGQKLYSVGENGELIGRIATSDAGRWLEDDAIPDTLIDILRVFFDEMWPVLTSSARVLSEYIASDAHAIGDELPGKTFFASPGFEALQTEAGALTHEFTIGGLEARRMVIPYQLWMLQRIERVLSICTASSQGRRAIEGLLAGFDRGGELLELESLMAGCRIRKQGGRLYSHEVGA